MAAQKASKTLVTIQSNIAGSFQDFQDTIPEQIELYQSLGVRKVLWTKSVKDARPSAKGCFSVSTEHLEKFVSFHKHVSPALAACPYGRVADIPFEVATQEIDFELGYGGSFTMDGAAMLTCELTLAGTYDEWKAAFITKATSAEEPLYPGMSKCFACKGGDDKASFVVVFSAAALEEAKLQHTVEKPTVMREFVEAGLVRSVDALTWDTVNSAVDLDNVAGAMQHLEVWGRVTDHTLAKIDAACEHLARTQQTFSYQARPLIEADFEATVRETVQMLKGKSRDHLRVHAGMPLVMCNGEYVGSIREFEAWARRLYGYSDRTPDSLYASRARKALQRYMAEHAGRFDFLYLDLGVKGADGETVPIRPRVTIQVFRELLPKTSENFTALCEGAYAGCAFHRVVPHGWVQAGAVGGDESVYGGLFEDESFALKHRGAGDVAMASAAAHANGSQFYISLERLAYLDGKKVVFGRVVDGMKAVRQVGRADVHPWNQRPAQDHVIVACGKLGGSAPAVPDAAVPGPAADGEGAKPEAPAPAAGDAEAEAEAAEEEASAAAAAAEPHSVNDAQDDAQRAAAKIGHAGKGFIMRQRAKKMKEASFAQTVAGASAEDIWAVVGDFEGKLLVAGGALKAVAVEGGVKLGAVRKVTSPADEARNEVLVTLNPKKMWLSYTESGHGDDANRFVECTSTWKVRPEGESFTVKLDVKYVLKDEQAAGDDLAPAWEAAFQAAVKLCVAGAAAAPAPAEEKPAEDAPAAEEAAAEEEPAEEAPAAEEAAMEEKPAEAAAAEEEAATEEKPAEAAAAAEPAADAPAE